MLRLVNQFDPPRARAQAASPKSSGCSCCCCCCVATTLTACSITAAALGRVAPREQPTALPPTAQVDARPSDPGMPASLPEVPQLGRKLGGYRVLAFLLLPLALIAGGALAAFPLGASPFRGFLYVLGFVGTWLGVLLWFRQKLGFHGGWIVALLVGWPIVSILEAWIWIASMK